MSIRQIPKEELELLSYKDMTNMILTEDGKKSTAAIFQEIVDLLGLSKNVFESKIGDYYTSLTTDKRFILLSDGTWDLRSRHTSDKAIIKIDDEEEEMEEIKDENEDLSDNNEDTDEFEADVDDEEDFDDTDEELKDLVVLDEDELELEQ